jgi:hypothetical protein
MSLNRSIQHYLQEITPVSFDRSISIIHPAASPSATPRRIFGSCGGKNSWFIEVIISNYQLYDVAVSKPELQPVGTV